MALNRTKKNLWWAADDFPPFAMDSPHLGLFMSRLFDAWAPTAHQTTVENEALCGRAPSEGFLEQHRKRLDPLICRYLEACLATPFSFHEILSSSSEWESGAVWCKAVRSGARLIWDKNRQQPSRGEHDSRAPCSSAPARPTLAVMDILTQRVPVAGEMPRRARARIGRSAIAARFVRFEHCQASAGVPGRNGLEFPPRVFWRSILGKWTTTVLLVQITPPLPSNSHGVRPSVRYGPVPSARDPSSQDS
jgi:hypothetical protein